MPGTESTLWKKGPKFDQLWRHRAFLENIVAATHGRVLLHAAWYSALTAHFKGQISSDAVLKMAYRSRAMIAHLRDCKRDGKRAPRRYAKLQGLIDDMQVQIEPKTGKRTSTELAMQEVSDEVIEVTPIKKEKVPTVNVDSNSDAEYDFKLFKSATGHATRSPATSSGAHGVDVDALVKQTATIPGIDPRTGNKNFGWGDGTELKKRPAAAMRRPAGVAEKPASHEDPTNMKKTSGCGQDR
ncbi:unnamed protein product [Prorocentrum cordatum]|uniref:Uncharacterized protein n=1 Tax=Prorocentrum cordatum TaxID=2364126 RepID=A0ABN9Y5T7_9DINO|nr:unnamed protein product [Polarella glacialis]